MHKTGLFDLIQNNIIHDLNDYVTGVETGLDSNGRKNRGGHQMEHLVEYFIKKSGATYSREIKTSRLIKQFGITLPESFAKNKRWDFAVKTLPASGPPPGVGHVYTIESNFYASYGSKISETARSYRLIAEEARNIPSFTFVWITDGKGWEGAKNDLHETFSVLDTIFNIKDMENGVFSQIFSA